MIADISVHVGDAMDHPSHHREARVSYTSVGEAVSGIHCERTREVYTALYIYCGVGIYILRSEM